MKRLLIVGLALGLVACGKAQPVVTNGDIIKHMESQGYSKVLIRDSINCGSMGKGRHFIATNKAKQVLPGQVCYRKLDGKVSYVISEFGAKKAKPANDDVKAPLGNVSNPWKAK